VQSLPGTCNPYLSDLHGINCLAQFCSCRVKVDGALFRLPQVVAEALRLLLERLDLALLLLDALLSRIGAGTGSLQTETATSQPVNLQRPTVSRVECACLSSLSSYVASLLVSVLPCSCAAGCSSACT
jgi:hypothetical protein